MGEREREREREREGGGDGGRAGEGGGGGGREIIDKEELKTRECMNVIKQDFFFLFGFWVA